MALSNILREPRREITETAVGLAIIVPFIYCDHALANWLSKGSKTPAADRLFFMIFGPFVMLMVSLVALVLVVGVHNLGEVVCNALERKGLRLRPMRHL